MNSLRSRYRLLLAGALVISVLLRLGAAVYLGDTVEDLPGTADQVSYHALALRVLGGHGFTFGEPWWPATAAGAPTAHWSYLYTLYLVVVYALFGPNPLVARLIQALAVGLLQPYLAYFVGKQVFGEKTGLLSAWITALYAYFIYYAANLMTEAFYICAILGSLALALLLASKDPGEAGSRFGVSRREWKLAVALGISLAAGVLLRQLFLLFIPFLFLWLLLASRGRRLAELLVSGALIVAVIVPITAFNYSRFQRFVLLNTNAGFAFYWGNHPIYGTRFEPILPAGTYADLLPAELLSLDEAALDQALLKRALGFVVADPFRYLMLSASRIPAYFMFWPAEDSGLISNLSRVASFGILWPFMLYGLILALPKRSSNGNRLGSPEALLYLFILVYTAIHLLTWALIRYRLPVDAVLVGFAALALIDLAGRVPAFRRLLGAV
jgi:4-amino-4-deoxy-L-arabinose transferase-like glycosyltransferase